jgi:uncharacterized protein YkwD
MVAACVGVVVVGAVACAPAAATPSPAQRARACQGVQLLSGPLIVSGISDPLAGTVILEQIGPVDDLVTCESVDAPLRPRPSGVDSCARATAPATKLPKRRATKAIGCLINEVRRSSGLNTLAVRGELKRAAKAHNRRMLTGACFSHQCSGEPDLVQRVTSAGYLPCRCAWTVGENLAWGVRWRSSPAAIVDAWMHSPPHREMMLRRGIEDVGVGVISGRPGSPRAKGATYTADFGVKN